MALLDVTKRQLGYINADAETDLLLQVLLDEGKSFLNAYCPNLDYEKPTRARSLLISYVQYALSNARDDFPKNYRSEILSLSNRGRIARYASSKTEQDDSLQSGSAPVSGSEPE